MTVSLLMDRPSHRERHRRGLAGAQDETSSPKATAVCRCSWMNTDRLLVPVLIVGSLTLAGWLVSLLQTL
jgi:hypothetical protein